MLNFSNNFGNIFGLIISLANVLLMYRIPHSLQLSAVIKLVLTRNT